MASGDVGATPKTHSWFGIWARGPLGGEERREGRTKSGTYDKLVAAAAAAAEIAFTVDHSGTLCSLQVVVDTQWFGIWFMLHLHEFCLKLLLRPYLISEISPVAP